MRIQVSTFELRHVHICIYAICPMYTISVLNIESKHVHKYEDSYHYFTTALSKTHLLQN
jgi:hypothetical protein